MLWLVAVVELHQVTRSLLPRDGPAQERVHEVLWEFIRDPAAPLTEELSERAEEALAGVRKAARPSFHAEVLLRYYRRYARLAGGLALLETMALWCLLDPPTGVFAVLFGVVAFAGTTAGFMAVVHLPLKFTREMALASREREEELQRRLDRKSVV